MRGESDKQSSCFIVATDLDSRVRPDHRKTSQQAHIAASAFNLIRLRLAV